MVQVKLLNATQDYIIIEYLTNGITISVKINNDAPVQDMIIKGYNEIKPHIDIECKRLGITDIDHTLLIIDETRFFNWNTCIEKLILLKVNKQ